MVYAKKLPATRRSSTISIGDVANQGAKRYGD
jgi:hypothetical protein